MVVIPAQAGIHGSAAMTAERWTPTFVGVTTKVMAVVWTTL